jgi:hypothetical protein
MTPPERAAEAPPQVGAPQSVAQKAGAAPEHHAAPVPQPTAGAVSRAFAAPAVAPLTAGAPNPESGAPAVSHGWAAALTGEKAHWVPEGAPRGEHNRRLTGLTLEGYDAFIDERGLAEGAELPPCRTCCRKLARMSAPSEPTQP